MELALKGKTLETFLKIINEIKENKIQLVNFNNCGLEIFFFFLF